MVGRITTGVTGKREVVAWTGIMLVVRTVAAAPLSSETPPMPSPPPPVSWGKRYSNTTLPLATATSRTMGKEPPRRGPGGGVTHRRRNRLGMGVCVPGRREEMADGRMTMVVAVTVPVLAVMALVVPSTTLVMAVLAAAVGLVDVTMTVGLTIAALTATEVTAAASVGTMITAGPRCVGTEPPALTLTASLMRK